MTGIPLTIGFVSKYRFAVAAFERAEILIPTLVVLAASTALNAFYFGRAAIQLYTQPSEKRRVQLSSAERSFNLSAMILLAINIVTGVAAAPLIRLLEKGFYLIMEAMS